MLQVENEVPNVMRQNLPYLVTETKFEKLKNEICKT